MQGDWLALGGDVVVAAPVQQPGNERLLQALTVAQTTFVNLEVPLTRHHEPAERVVNLRSNPEAVTALATMGVDVVTLANNHTLDHCHPGLAETTRTLEAAGIGHVGAGTKTRSAIAPHIRHTDSGVVALFGFACTLPAGWAAGARRPGIAPIRVSQQVSIDAAVVAEQPGSAPFVHTEAFDPDVEVACERIAQVRDQVDLVVVGIHWGVPPGLAARANGLLATYQRPLAHRLVDAGSDVVAGHHPHVVHPVEVYGRGLIAYSLGNLVFHPWSDWAPSDGDDAAAGFDAELPLPPYRNPFDDPATLESTVVLIARAGTGITCRFVPTVMVDGTPVLTDGDRARAVLDRLTSPDWVGGATPELLQERDPELGPVARLDLPLQEAVTR